MDRLVILVTKLAAAFPRENPTEATLAVYAEHLAGCDIETLEYVIEHAIAGAWHLPTIAELRDAYRVESQRRQDPQDALPMARTPMPPEVKRQLDELKGKVEDRATEMEPQA